MPDENKQTASFTAQEPVAPESFRGLVDQLERDLSDLPQTVIPTEHVISGGMYARTITVQPGTRIVGAANRLDHIIVVMGDISVLTDEGPRRIVGLHVFPTKAGMKRAGFTHGPTKWTAIWRTDATTVEQAEADAVEEPETLQTRRVLELSGEPAKLEA